MNETPHALAERYVIGALLTDSRVLHAVKEQVAPHDFEDLRLGTIYAGIIQMSTDRLPVDYLTVWDQLAAWGVKGIDLADLAGWARDVPTATNASYYGGLVRDAAVRRAIAAVGSKLQAAADPGSALTSALEELRQIRDRDTASLLSAKSLRQVLDVPETEDARDWVIPDLLEHRDRLMLTGSEGGGKSTMLRQIALLAAGGIHPFRFSPIDPIRVLVVDAENSERQWRRAVRRMVELVPIRGGRDPQDRVHLEFLSKVDITRPADQGNIHRLMDETQPDLLMIGPLYRLIPRAINSDDDAAPVLAALDGLRERDVAMLIEAHAGHTVSAGGDRDLRPRGSSALLGWPEFGLGLRRDKSTGMGGQPLFSLVRWRGDRDRRSFPPRFIRGQWWPWEPTGTNQGGQ